MMGVGSSQKLATSPGVSRIQLGVANVGLGIAFGFLLPSFEFRAIGGVV